MKTSTPLSLLGILMTASLVACAPTATAPSATGSSSAAMSSSPEAMMPSSEKMTPPSTPDEKIANAMSAGPESVTKDAAVLDWPATATGDLVSLRKGTNGWTCLPDQPFSPGNDPICADGNAMTWFGAYMQKKQPTIAQAGIAYMLQGGSDASNTDPFATEPAKGEDWMNAPPHVMIFPSSKLDPKVYGTAMNGGPWIMWAGTPYQHLMVSVK